MAASGRDRSGRNSSEDIDLSRWGGPSAQLSMASMVKLLRLLADNAPRLLHLLQGGALSCSSFRKSLAWADGISDVTASSGSRPRQDRRGEKHLLRVEGMRMASSPHPGGQRERCRKRSRWQALQLTPQKRQDEARDYFNQLAGVWRTIVWTHLGWPCAHAVGGSSLHDDCGSRSGRRARAVLAKRAKKVIAVDNSEKMVEFGGALARRHGFKSRIPSGDIGPAHSRGIVDLALFSQALHHAARGRAVAAAYRIVKPGGRVAFLDLLQHQFEARALCRHVAQVHGGRFAPTARGRRFQRSGGRGGGARRAEPAISDNSRHGDQVNPADGSEEPGTVMLRGP